MKPTNTAKRTLWIWLAIGLIGGIAAILPFVVEIDIFNGGGAMIMIGLVFFITGPIVALMYWYRAKVFDELLEEKNLLAHWKYDLAEWKKFAKDEYEYRKGANWWLFVMVAIFSLVIGAVFWIADPESGFLVMLVMIGLIVLIGVVAILATWGYKSWENNTRPEARIGVNGLFIHDQLHVWVGWGAKLEGVNLKINSQKILEITYSTPNRYSRQYYTIRVLVPADQEKIAREIQAKLG